MENILENVVFSTLLSFAIKWLYKNNIVTIVMIFNKYGYYYL